MTSDLSLFQENDSQVENRIITAPKKALKKTPKTLLLGISGSIAAFKAADLISPLREKGISVFVVMTEEATQFITPLTLQTLSRHPVLIHLSQEEASSWQPGHIQLADAADLFLIAPATASTLARLSYGFADDALSAIALATRAPLFLAPAMNGKMWMHPTTQENVQRLEKRGATIIPPESGMLACGYEGIGRLASIETILTTLLNTPELSND